MELPLERETEGFEKTAPSRAVSSSSLRFLSPTRGTEGVVKTIDKEEFEKAFLNDKEGRVGFRKTILSVVVFSASQRREEEK